MKILFWEWKKNNNQQTSIQMRMSLICIIENMVVHREHTMNYINRINRFNGWYLLIQLSSAQFNSVQFGLNLTCFGRHSIGKYTYSLCEFSLHLPAGTIFCVRFFFITISIYSQWIFEDYIARLNFNGRARFVFIFPSFIRKAKRRSSCDRSCDIGIHEMFNDAQHLKSVVSKKIDRFAMFA